MVDPDQPGPRDGSRRGGRPVCGRCVPGRRRPLP